jgi:hypothetical protein
MTRNKRSKRKTRKIRGGGIRFDGTWKAEPGIRSPDRLAYSNAEASFLNYMRIGRLQNELTWYGNIDAVIGAFLALDTGNIMEATTQEKMRVGGYTAMLNAIGSLTNAIAGRNRKDEDFKKVDTITEIDDRGRQTERPITEEEKERHRYRTQVLQAVLDALDEAKKPYDEKYNGFVKPKKVTTEKPTLDFTALPVGEGVDLPADNTPSLPPQVKSRPKDTSTFEEQLAEAKEQARVEQARIEHEKERVEQARREYEKERVESVPKKVDYCPGPGCNKVAESQCSRCKSVKYCSPECQKKCWKEHKPFCLPVTPVAPVAPLPYSHYVATLPFYVEDVRSLAFLNSDKFFCYAITKTQLLAFTEMYDLYTGPYGVEKKERIELKDTDYNRKTKAVVHAFKTGKIPKEELEESLMQLVREANTEEKSPVLTREEVERIRTEGQEAKSTSFTRYTMLKKYKEKIDTLIRDISVTNENMDTLITYLDSQKNPFIKSELAKLKVKYGSLQRTDALVQDIQTMLIETQKKLAQKSVDKLLEQVEQFYQVRRDLKRAKEFYEAEKAKYEAFRAKNQKLIRDYENLTEIGIPLHSQCGLLVIQNNVIVSMDHCMYDINRGFKIGSVEGCNDGTNLTCRMSQPTDMVSDGDIILCTDTRNHSIVSYRIEKNKLDFITQNIPGYVNGKDISTWRLNTPMGITFDENGDIIIADTGNDCIRKMSLGNGKNNLITIAGKQPGEVTSKLSMPMSVCMLGNSIIVTDTGNHCIRKLTKKTDGSYTMVVIAGTYGTPGYKNGHHSLFNTPVKVAVWNGHIYVADRGNNRIRVILDHDPRPGEFPKNLIV